MMIFYYWLTDVNGKTERIMSEDYLGDVGETGFYAGSNVTITDWCMEEWN